MSFEAIRTGCVLDYPYLWAREHADKETEGRKSRRIAVGIRIPTKTEGGNDTVILYPITSQPPAEGVLSIEIPETERRRAGLDHDKRLWIMLDEYNHDLIGTSYYLDPTGPVGAFGKAFFEELLRLVFKYFGEAIPVDRRA